MPTSIQMIYNVNISKMIMDHPGETLDEKLLHCACCDCCERHSINRPFILAPLEQPQPHEKDEAPCCPCNCRHVARYICRIVDNNNTQYPSLHWNYFQN